MKPAIAFFCFLFAVCSVLQAQNNLAGTDLTFRTTDFHIW